MKHIIEAKQFKKKEDLLKIFSLANELENLDKKNQLNPLLKGKILANLFYEPSTRTKFSFEAAMLKLGGQVIGTESASHFSSAIKGESLKDTIRTVGKYADIIVLRHPEEGSSKIASQISSIPIINAGDGPGQHPTQALLDMYTIQKELGRIDNLKIAMIGDLLYGRTVHSLTYLLAQQNNIEFIFVSPKQIKLPRDLIKYLKNKKIKFEETEDLKKSAQDSDILYVTRIQKERFRTVEEYEKLKGCYIINKDTLSIMKKNAIIMHPLPRVDEIATEVDDDPRAAYFRQAKNGLYMRMALLKILLT